MNIENMNLIKVSEYHFIYRFKLQGTQQLNPFRAFSALFYGLFDTDTALTPMTSTCSYLYIVLPSKPSQPT